MSPDALAAFSAFCDAMKSWEERASVSLADKTDPDYEAKKRQLHEELHKIHEKHCLDGDWAEAFIVSTPPFFQFDVVESVPKTRNHLIVHVIHKDQSAYPYRFQAELRCKDGNWKVASLWQTLANGKRIRCPF